MKNVTPIQEDVEFVDTNGRLPPMWPRQVTFFANLLALFFGNEEQTRSLAEEVGEIDSYSARLIPILNLLYRHPENLLVLERDPDPVLCRYLEDDLGLSLPQLSVMQHSEYVALGQALAESDADEASRFLTEVTRHPSQWIDGYVTDDVVASIAAHLGRGTIATRAGSQDGNNKLLLHLFLSEQGLPIFDTVLANSQSDLPRCTQELASRGYRSVVLRSQIGASGIGMFRLKELDRPEAFPEIPDYFFYEGPCLVQGWLERGVLGVERLRSPSTQLFVNDTHVYAYDMTEQILSDESIHQGNESPPSYFPDFPGLREETMLQAKLVGRWLHSTGYRGTASIDWLIVERAGQAQPDVFVCEVNARVTGATYPSLLARHFHPTGAWLLRNLRLRVPMFSEDLLQMFDVPGHLFRQGDRKGIIPLNLNFGEDGLVHKGQFLCIGETTDECHRFLSLAEQDLPVEWHGDRD